MTRIANEDLASRLAKVEYNGGTELPEYFRQVRMQYWEDWDDDLKEALSAVLKNNLTYAGAGYEAGGEPYLGYFLCATVDDDDLPWDRTQTDW